MLLLCAGYANGASGGCYGDDGGPHAQNGQVIGIMMQWKLASCGGYTLFTDVYSHNAWIKGITGL